MISGTGGSKEIGGLLGLDLQEMNIGPDDIKKSTTNSLKKGLAAEATPSKADHEKETDELKDSAKR